MNSVCPKSGNNPVPLRIVPGKKDVASGGGVVGRAFTLTADEVKGLPDIYQAVTSGKRKEN